MYTSAECFYFCQGVQYRKREHIVHIKWCGVLLIGLVRAKIFNALIYNSYKMFTVQAKYFVNPLSASPTKWSNTLK